MPREHSTFYRAFECLKVHEGGYVDHPDDPGGATMKGVTQRTYNAYLRRRGRTVQPVREITDDEVEDIYRRQFWDAVRADELPQGVAYCVFDAAVNSGVDQAVKWLQRVIGAKVDGIVGEETLSLAEQTDPVHLINVFCDKRLAFMRRLSHWPTFKDGWTRRVAEVRSQSLEWADQGAVATETTQPPMEKAEGRVSLRATAVEAVKDRGAISAVGGLLGSAGTLASGSGPIQYAVAAVLVMATITAIWWVVREHTA
jgi:lysozyme family protein